MKQERIDLEQLSRRAETVNSASQIIAEADRSSRFDWFDPEIDFKPFNSNFPRKMPVLSRWVVEANEMLARGGDEGGISECPFEFYLTHMLHLFWDEVEEYLRSQKRRPTQETPSVPVAHFLLKEASWRVNGWSYEFPPEDGLVEVLAGDQPVALIRFTEDGVIVGYHAHRWGGGASDPYPCLNKENEIGWMNWELTKSPAGIPVFIDLVRRSAFAFHRRHRICQNCGGRVLRVDIESSVCDSCRGVVY